MSLVGKVGRKRPRARFAMAMLYTILVVGAITTIYPFLLMMTTGFKGPTDQNDNKLVPAFWSDASELEKKYLNDKYSGDVAQIASTRIGADASPEAVRLYEEFLMQLPVDAWSAGFRTPAGQVTGKLTMRYQQWLHTRFSSVAELNEAYLEENVAFQTVAPPAELLERKTWAPRPGRKYDDWLVFKASLPAEYRIPVREQRMYQEHLRSKYQGQIAEATPEEAGGATVLEQVPLPPKNSAAYAQFRDKALPERYRDGAAEALWQRWLESRSATATAVLPVAGLEASILERQEEAVKREFNTRNYRYVLDYILLNGRALWNTAIFSLLLIATHLIVNPLAAYALSRYPIKASMKILLFLLATMAFPAEVAMIPSFLLLKDLGLLNTFAALILPIAASGYMIFLLKGFFDSLPQEVFDSGQIDGASELRMMLKIAMPLSKPVLGYIALMAFMSAYGAFLYAFLVAQEQRMWTLMVWIYQLQQSAPKAVMMAALTLAAIPTLVVFLLAQRVIMRGIVLPGER